MTETTTPTAPNRKAYHAIILAAGNGTRTGLATPKQHLSIHGKTPLQRCIDIFDGDSACKSITIVTDNENISNETTRKTLSIIGGGHERQDSVLNGLKALSHLRADDRVIIHDSARAHLHADDLIAITSSAAPAATLAKKIVDTLMKTGGDRPSRDDLYALQTPQIFDYGLITKAHEQASPDTVYTDDTSLTQHIGVNPDIIISQHYNEKITYEADIIMAHKLLAPNYEYRTGLGFDVHAFDSEKADKPLILCGVKLPDHMPLTGHSDADVGLHTITDALLGAVAEGDIGRHFPPSDNAYKDMDSAIFLKRAKDILDDKKAIITNIDLTFMCETPKITPHAPAMIDRVSDILSIPPSKISIKATTTEKLGFTGRKEGIAAQAVATVKVIAE